MCCRCIVQVIGAVHCQLANLYLVLADGANATNTGGDIGDVAMLYGLLDEHWQPTAMGQTITSVSLDALARVPAPSGVPH